MGIAVLAFGAGLALQERTLAAALPHLGADALPARLAVVGCEHLDAAEVARAAALPAGVPVAAVDPARVAARLREHPWIAFARVVPLPPATLLVRVAERVPVAVAAAGSGDDRLRVLDARGFPFAPADPELLQRTPLLLDPDGRPLPADAPAVADALRLLEAVRARPLPPVRAIEVGAADDPAFPRLHLRDLPTPILVGPLPHEPALTRLEQLLAGAPPGLAEAQTIDLRFADRAILAMSPSRTGTDQRRARADARARPNRDPAANAADPTPGG